MQSVAEAPLAIQDTPTVGLSVHEVVARVRQGQTNVSREHTSRSLADILRANLFTRFNLNLGTLLVVILIVGQWQDALFGIVLLSNALIGVVQELALMLSLCILVMSALPMTWRRVLLVGLVILGGAFAFSVGPIRTFFALELPHQVLWPTFLIGTAGTVLLVAVWQLSRRLALGTYSCAGIGTVEVRK